MRDAISPQSASQQLTPRDRWLLVVVTLAVLLPGVFGVSLADRDEGWYAEVSRQMLARGDWLMPHYRGEAWIAKPPLLYWCVAAAFHLFGLHAWAGRLVSVLAMTGVIQLLGTLAAGLYNRRVAWVACLSFVTAAMPAVVGKLLITDALLLACCVGAMVVLWQMVSQGTTPARAAGFWLLVGLGILAKGPAVIVFVGAFTLALSTWSQVRRQLLRARLWLFAPLGLVVAAPWYCYVAVRAGSTFWQQFLGLEIAARLTGTPHGQGGPPGYYVLVSLAGWMPWTVLLPGAVWGAWQARRSERVAWPLLIWWALPWLFLELIPSKLPHYILPCYVPLGILLGRWWGVEGAAAMTKARAVALGMWVGLSILGGVALLILAVLLWSSLWSPPAGVLGVVLVVGFALTGRRLVCGRRLAAWGSAVCTAAAMHILVGCWVLPSLEPHRLSRQIADAADAMTQDGQEVLVSGYEEPTMFFYLRSPVRVVCPDELRAVLANAKTSPVLAVREEELFAAGLTAPEGRAGARRLTGFNYVKGKTQTVWVIPARP